MKKYKIKRIAAAAALASLTLLATACGSGSSSTPVVTTSGLTNGYGTGGAYGCVSQTFGFIGTGVYIGSSNVYAGIPNQFGPAGQVQLSSTPQGGGQYTNTTMPNGAPRTLSDVALTFSVVGGSSYGSYGANIAGSFQISPARQAVLAVTENGQCPIAMAFQSGVYGQTLYGGAILYLQFPSGNVEQLQI